MSGLLERVVEDWLTRSDERGYQYAFASLLGHDGESVKYVSQHSVLEHGKDIVSTKGRRVFTYQLKAGNVNKQLWRKIRDEVLEAAEVPIDIPGLPHKTANRAFLVSTGRVADSVRNEISLRNEALKSRGYAIIEVIDKDELANRFSRAFDTFYPQAVGAFGSLLALYSQSGRSLPDLDSVSRALAGLVGKDDSSPRILSRALSNVVVGAQVAAAPCRSQSNHVGQIVIWTVAACVILRTAKQKRIARSDWGPEFNLCVQAVREAGASLLDELFGREDLVEYPSPSEAILIHFRRPLVLGFAAAAINQKVIAGRGERDDTDRLFALTTREAPFNFWGESAWNYVINLVIALRHDPEAALLGEALVSQWLTVAASSRPPYLREPYYSPSKAISELGENSAADDSSLRPSYTSEAAMYFLARRGRRQVLKWAWGSLSKTKLATFIPTRIYDLLQPQCGEGSLQVRSLPLEGSWGKLVDESFRMRSSLFNNDAAELLPMFLAVFSHRVDPALAAELDFRTSPPHFREEWAKRRS